MRHLFTNLVTAALLTVAAGCTGETIADEQIESVDQGVLCCMNQYRYYYYDSAKTIPTGAVCERTSCTWNGSWSIWSCEGGEVTTYYRSVNESFCDGE